MRIDWPDGFAVHRQAGAPLVAIEDRMAAALAAGLDTSEGWESFLSRAAAPRTSGRGDVAVIDLAGSPVRLKRLRRGGLAGPLWRGRILGTRRLYANLELPIEAARRGVSTPPPVALLMVRGPLGLYRAWLAFEEVVGAVDLFRATCPPAALEREALARVLAEVRHMHDAGVEHRDLNLGNVLIRDEGAPGAWIIDLDRGRLHAGPLGWRKRKAALDRLERSWEKAVLGGAVKPAVSLTDVYAAGDAWLAERLARGRRLGRYRTALHRLGWRRLATGPRER